MSRQHRIIEKMEPNEQLEIGLEEGSNEELEEESDAEDDAEDIEDIDDPWDPKLIRVDPKVFSMRHVLDMIDNGDLVLAPGFQRRKVWDEVRKSRLIESILLRIPLPAFYFSEDTNGELKVVDGLQRLSAIHDFVRGEGKKDSFHSLSKLEYLNELTGKKYEDIKDTFWARRIDSTQISVNVIDPSTPRDVRFNIFKRINTGGEPLNEQEIRHCMNKQRSRDFLEELTSTNAFNKATNNQLKNHTRMLDREVALRFCSFRLLYLDTLSEELKKSNQVSDIVKNLVNHDLKIPKIGEFLDKTTRKIDDDFSDELLDRLKKNFERAMTNASRLFMEHAFRKWPTGSNRVSPINRALFEVWSVILADYEWSVIKPHKTAIVEKARDMMLGDDEYIASISTATGTLRRIVTRYWKVRGILAEVEL